MNTYWWWQLIHDVVVVVVVVVVVAGLYGWHVILSASSWRPLSVPQLPICHNFLLEDFKIMMYMS